MASLLTLTNGLRCADPADAPVCRGGFGGKMSRVLRLSLVAHWAVMFSLLTVLAIVDRQALNGLAVFGVDFSSGDYLVAAVPVLATGIALAFAICATLFWWAFVTLFATSEDWPSGDVTRIAFSAAFCLMTLLLLIGAVRAAAGLFPAMAAYFAALSASYLAIRMEQQAATSGGATDEDPFRLAARAKAIGASRMVALSRLTDGNDGRRSPDR